MAPAWERVKRALANRLCIRVAAQQVAIEDSPPLPETAVAAVAVEGEEEAEMEEEREKSLAALSPARVSALRLSRSGSRSSMKICAICLGGMRSGHGQALFTAECSHKFHFNCISSNVRHGNLVCPMCRAVWKELPFLGALHAPDATIGAARVSPLDSRLPDDGGQQIVAAAVRRPASRWQMQFPIFRGPVSDRFDDDEELDLREPEVGAGAEAVAAASVGITTYTELPAVQQSVAVETFAVLIHLRAPPRSPASSSIRAPLDLVTVLDVSYSMTGRKLALLKRAMGFVIEALGPSDRLSVVAFSSMARRLFPLRKMTASGREQSLREVNALLAEGGTNIADALSMAARVMEDRLLRNPVCSIVLLSDGRDTYSVTPPAPRGVAPDYGLLVPRSILPGGSGHHVQVHAFGFGSDHDSAAMHYIAELSGGTFSFIDAAGSIQDAFAQCIGGLLSVVVQEMRLSVECADQGVLLTSVKSGGYPSRVDGDRRGGFVDVGDLYADEERDFLLTVRVPAAAGGESALVRPSCSYRDAVTMETLRVVGDTVVVPRPVDPVSSAMSPEVEREWHRVHAMEDMAAARAAAEQGDFARAVSILEERRRVLVARVTRQPWDTQALALVTEMREMQERVETRQRYDESGRAYMLAGLSSHSWQRATARGDSTELTSLIHTYQTPLMVDMVQRSQTLLPEVVEALNRSPTVALGRSPASPSPRRTTRSFPGRP